MKTILITGVGGFVGSNIAEYYIRKGDKVIGIDNLTKHELIKTGYKVNESREFIWNNLKKIGVELHLRDIRNPFIEKHMYQDIDYIVNCAAQPAMTISIEKPDLDLNVNVLGTLNLLELARKLDIPILLFSTIHVYGTGINNEIEEGKTRYIRNPVEISESHEILTGILTPLHASKRAMEIYGKTYTDTYGLRVGIFRATGMYGSKQFGGEDHGWVANFCIRNIMEYPITIFGTGKQVRDILYIDDVNRAIDAYYKNSNVSGIFNIGGGEDTMISLIECIKLIEEITGKKSNIQYKPERKGDLRYFVCDNSRAFISLNWKPSIKPKEGITKLVNWIRRNKELFK